MNQPWFDPNTFVDLVWRTCGRHRGDAVESSGAVAGMLTARGIVAAWILGVFNTIAAAGVPGAAATRTVCGRRRTTVGDMVRAGLGRIHLHDGHWRTDPAGSSPLSRGRGSPHPSRSA